jgi:hypothetical protein
VEKVLGLADTRAGFAVLTSVMLLVGLLIRVRHLGASDLWVDEGISYYLATLSPVEIIRYTAQNISEHPPGYYLSLHYWMKLAGSSEYALRYFSGLGGILYFSLLIMLVRRWFGNRLALLAGLLFCVQPLAMTLSRDTRMYTWYGVGVLLVVYLFDRAIQRVSALNWLLFALAALFAVAFNYLSVLTLFALGLFAVIKLRTLGRRALPLLLILLVLFGVPLLWIATSPGPRGSMGILFDVLREPWSPDRLMWIYFGWPLSGAADAGPTPALWLLAGLRWVLAIVGIVWMVRPRRWPRQSLQLLLSLLIVVPPLLASLVFPVVKQRFFFPTVGFFLLAVTLGIVACWRRFRPFGALLAGVLVVSLLVMDAQYAQTQVKSGWRPFSTPIKFILAQARPHEPIVYTYLWENYEDVYYNAGRQPVDFVPPRDAPVTVEEAEASARKDLEGTGSAWLVIYPSALKPEIVEQGFSIAGFPGEKRWFAGDRGVVRYFSERPLAEQAGGLLWADRIKLNRWWTSSAQIPAGDALRLQFEWQDVAANNTTPADERPSDLIELSLVGADGQAWTTRVGTPCNGLCPVSGWQGKAAQDREALYIPSDIPPGRYAVRLRWLTSNGEPILVRSANDPTPQAFVNLLSVDVLPPIDGSASEASLARKPGVQTPDGELILVSVSPPAGPIRPAGSVTVPMQWRTLSPASDLEARLILIHEGQETVVRAPLGPAWYTSDAWTPGRLVRTQPAFTIPGTLPPGEYETAVAIGPRDSGHVALRAPLGALTVRDRERRFDLPDVGQPVAVAWQEGIRLARADVPAQAKAGEPMTATLVWQAGRPTGGNWKVFMHLVDAQGTVLGQGDGYPLSGLALTPTWQAGEVIVDPHRIELPRDLAPGEYLLRVGFYNESTNERLPTAAGGDTYEWPTPIRVAQP